MYYIKYIIHSYILISTHSIIGCCCCCRNNQTQNYSEQHTINNQKTSNKIKVLLSEDPLETITIIGEVNKIKSPKSKIFINSLSQESQKNILDSTEDDIENYIILLEKYRGGKDINNIKVEETKSANRCKKITFIDNGDVVFIKKDKGNNKLYIDLLKHLGLCDIEYIFNGDYLLTKEIKDIIVLDTNTEMQLENTLTILSQIENFLPFYTILSFLNLKDCGLGRLDNVSLKQENGNYSLKALDISLDKKLTDDKSYKDFYDVLRRGTKGNTFLDKYKGIEKTYNKKNYENFNKFFVTLYSNSDEIDKILKFTESKNNDNDIKLFKKITFCDFLYQYCDGFENISKNAQNYDKLKEIYDNKYKGDYDNFIKAIIKYSWNYEVNNKKILQDKIRRKSDEIIGHKIEDINEYSNWLKKVIDSPIFESMKAMIKEHVLISNNQYIVDRINKITNDEKDEIRKYYDKMLDFLILNKGNNEYDKSRYNFIVSKIKLIKNNGLFEFLYNNTTIQEKLKKL